MLKFCFSPLKLTIQAIISVIIVCSSITFLSLNDILALTLNSHYVPVKAVLKLVVISVSHSHLLQVISKQVAITGPHSHVHLLFGANNLPRLLSPYLSGYPFENKVRG